MATTDSSRPTSGPPEVQIRSGGITDPSALAALLAALLLAALVGWRAGPLAAAVALVALLTAAWRCWAPWSIEMGPLGVTQVVFGVRRRTDWRDLGQIEFLAQGVLITPNPGWPLAGLRSLYIPYLGERGSIERTMRFYIGQRLQTRPTSTYLSESLPRNIPPTESMPEEQPPAERSRAAGSDSSTENLPAPRQ